MCLASLCFHYNYCLCICFDIIRRCVLQLCAFITITVCACFDIIRRCVLHLCAFNLCAFITISVCAYVLTLLEGVSCIFVLSLQLVFGGGDSRVVASRTSKQEGPGSIPGGGKEV